MNHSEIFGIIDNYNNTNNTNNTNHKDHIFNNNTGIIILSVIGFMLLVSLITCSQKTKNRNNYQPV